MKIFRTEIGITNSVGANAVKYFRHLGYFIGTVEEDIMILPWNKLKDVIEPEPGVKKRDTLVIANKGRAILPDPAPTYIMFDP